MTSKILASGIKRFDKAWHLNRKEGIGGSEVAAIFGVDNWKSASQVYLEKVNPHHIPVPNEKIRDRIRLKDYIAREFSHKTGFQLIRRNVIYKSPNHPFMIGSIDRWVCNENAGLLCKSVNEYNRKEWENNVPYKYKLQCQHYMEVTGADKWWIAILIGGITFKFFCVDREEDLIQEIVEKEKYFWEEFIQKRKTPPHDGSIATKKFINELFPSAKEREIKYLPPESYSYISQYLQSQSEVKKAHRYKQEAENNLKDIMGEYQFGVLDNFKVEWKNVKRGDTLYRRLSISQLDKG